MGIDITTFNFENKKVLLRADFNLSLDQNFIPLDVFRIKQTISTVKKILDGKGIVIIASHIGRPKGKYNEKYSLKHIIEPLKFLNNANVLFAPDCIGSAAIDTINKASNGDMVLLENVRFHPGEEAGDEIFAKELADLGDIYINDGFSVSHRNHASTAITPKFFSDQCKALGFLCQSELSSLSKILNANNKPITSIIGGSKVSTKVPVINNLIKKVDNLIIGGAMAFSFIKALNHNIGRSFFEPDTLDICLDIFKKAKDNNTNIYLPIDVVAADNINSKENIICNITDIPNNLQGLDIGPKTIDQFINIINSSLTLLWNGPMGVFEKKEFSNGTYLIGNAISKHTDKDCYSVAGGGDTVAAINTLNIDNNFSHISTAGGAMLDFLAGRELPGIRAIIG
ncbi:MAG: phosphoglycerate kinase [Solitalea-like symbiont of Tyrophagus putrescentiae]